MTHAFDAHQMPGILPGILPGIAHQMPRKSSVSG
jgi:hypothetical protein